MDASKMQTKKMQVADLNVVFGKEEEPLIKWLDQIVLPALTNENIVESTEITKYFFDEVCLNEIEKGEYIIQGILVKDTLLMVKSEYYKGQGLEKTNKKHKSSPYSIFLIYLKNHRMILVQNQQGSPDMRSFGSAFRRALNQYVGMENSTRDRYNKLPRCTANVAGIKTAQSVKETLKNVEKINELEFKFYPLNSEWDLDPVFGEIDQRIRKVAGSKNGKLILSSPESISGVADIVEATDGLVKTRLRVTYKSDLSMTGTKRKGTIKDNEISDVMNIDIFDELDESFLNVHKDSKDIKALSVESKENIVSYREFLERRK